MEEQAFYNRGDNRPATYTELSNMVNKFGCAGASAELNQRQIQVCFNQVQLPDEVRSAYFKQIGREEEETGGVPVRYLLHLLVLLCQHDSE